MTLGELKEELKGYGIKSIGTLGNVPHSSDKDNVVIYFSADKKIMFPYAPKTLYSLSMRSSSDSEVVHSEKIKALKRSLIPNWDEE
jgi:hypothetical protein